MQTDKKAILTRACVCMGTATLISLEILFLYIPILPYSHKTEENNNNNNKRTSTFLRSKSVSY
jgi:hypothetical protein